MGWVIECSYSLFLLTSICEVCCEAILAIPYIHIYTMSFICLNWMIIFLSILLPMMLLSRGLVLYLELGLALVEIACHEAGAVF